MNNPPEFKRFPSIARLSRPVYITEKIDGTNAIIHIDEDGCVFAGSRNRWLTVENDNFGFAKWVDDHRLDLSTILGPGTYHGEWWGSGIQRGYGLTNGERRLSLFNQNLKERLLEEGQDFNRFPFDFVPLMAILPTFDSEAIVDVMGWLKGVGSYAAPGYMDPEGIVIYHKHANCMFKKTFKNDQTGKTTKTQTP